MKIDSNAPTTFSQFGQEQSFSIAQNRLLESQSSIDSSNSYCLSSCFSKIWDAIISIFRFLCCYAKNTQEKTQSETTKSETQLLRREESFIIHDSDKPKPSKRQTPRGSYTPPSAESALEFKIEENTADPQLILGSKDKKNYKVTELEGNFSSSTIIQDITKYLNSLASKFNANWISLKATTWEQWRAFRIAGLHYKTSDNESNVSSELFKEYIQLLENNLPKQICHSKEKLTNIKELRQDIFVRKSVRLQKQIENENYKITLPTRDKIWEECLLKIRENPKELFHFDISEQFRVCTREDYLEVCEVAKTKEHLSGPLPFSKICLVYYPKDTSPF